MGGRWDVGVLVVNTGNFANQQVLGSLITHRVCGVATYSLHGSVRDNSNCRFVHTSVHGTSRMQTLFGRIYPSMIVGASTLSMPSFYRARRGRTHTAGVATMRRLTHTYRRCKDHFVRLSASFIFSNEASQLCVRRSRPGPIGCCKVAGLRKRRHITRYYNGCTVIHMIIICKGTLPNRRNGVMRLMTGGLHDNRAVHIISSR